jgi:uncharacterized membrane protein
MNAAHMHLVLNHIPVFTTAFGLVLLIFAKFGTNQTVLRMSLYTLIAGALFAVPAYLTGEPAENAVERMVGISDSSIDAHEDIAGIALASSALLGLAAASLVYWMHTRALVARPIVVGLIVLATASASLYTVTAYLGGQIHHSEIASVTRSGGVAQPDGDSD